MGKSLNNFIPLADPPEQMFIKLMQVNDEIIPDYLELLTSHPTEEIEQIKSALSDGSINPIDLKKQMASLVIQELHDATTADQAQKHFERTIQEKEQPDSIPEITIPDQLTLKEILNRTRSSTTGATQSENTRPIQQGAVRLDDVVMTDPFAQVSLEKDSLLRVGKKHWYQLRKEA